MCEKKRERQGQKPKKREGRIICCRNLIGIFTGILLFWWISLDVHAMTWGYLSGLSLLEQYYESRMPAAEAGEDEEDAEEEFVPEPTYAELHGLAEVEKPKKRKPREVLAKLKELSEEFPVIGEILEQKELYPDNMLEALANNPEMTEFVKEYPEHIQESVTGNATGNVTGNAGNAAGNVGNAPGSIDTTEKRGLTETEKRMEFPLLLQWDPRWGYTYYGDDSVIGLAGCGPTCLSMVLFYLTGEDAWTPDKVAEYAMENDYYMAGTGTMWKLFDEMPQRFGLSVENLDITEDCLAGELEKGNILVMAVRTGDFTAVGHFLVVYGYDEEGFRINDPNCVARSGKSYSFERLKPQIKNVWSIGSGGAEPARENG